MAQTASDRGGLATAASARAEQSRLGAATSQEPGGWDIEINLPMYWSSNAVQTFGDQTNLAGSPKADWHVSPDALLRYTYQFDWVKVSAKLDVGEDRYFQQITVNQDAVFATLKAEFTDGRSDLFVPYVAYTPEVDFLPFFAHWQDSLQDFYGGFTERHRYQKRQARRVSAMQSIRATGRCWSSVGAGERLACAPRSSRTRSSGCRRTSSTWRRRTSLYGSRRPIGFRHYPDFSR